MLAILPSFPPSSFSQYLPPSRQILSMFYVIMSCKGPFSEIFTFVLTTPSTFFSIFFPSGLALCVFYSLSPCFNWRQGNNFKNIKKNMISIYLLVLIRVPNDLIRQHEQNMSDLNEHVFPSWQINEREDIVKLTCVF